MVLTNIAMLTALPVLVLINLQSNRCHHCFDTLSPQSLSKGDEHHAQTSTAHVAQQMVQVWTNPDVRSNEAPGSKRTRVTTNYPKSVDFCRQTQYCKSTSDTLSWHTGLAVTVIAYTHIPTLRGRRMPKAAQVELRSLGPSGKAPQHTAKPMDTESRPNTVDAKSLRLPQARFNWAKLASKSLIDKRRENGKNRRKGDATKKFRSAH